MEAEIILDYDDEKVAQAIAKAISPDNFNTPKGLSVKTTWKDGTVFTKIKCERKLPTFTATIDDLLFSASTAEKTVQTTIELK